jgi:hypothetical protein
LEKRVGDNGDRWRGEALPIPILELCAAFLLPIYGAGLLWKRVL